VTKNPKENLQNQKRERERERLERLDRFVEEKHKTELSCETPRGMCIIWRKKKCLFQRDEA
jgi:hypothetical protein